MKIKIIFSAVLAHMTGTAAALTAAGANGPTTLLVSGGLGVIAGGLGVVLVDRSDDDEDEGGPTGFVPAIV